MSESLEEKQLYLRTEIIDQGYNPEDFSSFMGSIRGDNNLDLDTWSFADLQTVVTQFKSQISQIQNQQQQYPQQNENQEQPQEQPQEQNNNDTAQNAKEDDIEGAVKDTIVPEKLEQKISNSDNKFPNDAFDEYELIIKTGSLEKNEITDQNNLFVTVTNPVKVKASIFSSAYYQYTVETSPVRL